MRITTKKNIELKKHVSTIHCANTLSLLQRKIANALLYHAYDDLLIKDEHSISIKELSSLISYDSHDYKSIKRALVDLLTTVIEWNIIEEGLPETEGEWNASSIIADASIRGSLCTYSYSNRMKQLLYTPAVYGRLNMRIQSQFKSNYGLALYENVIRYQNLKQTPWFEMPVFRKMMGVAEGKYAIFRDFKRRVVDKAISEVNTFAGLIITPELKREKRAVAAIRFLISIKTITKDKPTLRHDDDQLVNRLNQEFGLTSQQADSVKQSYDSDYILEKMQLIETSSSYRSGKIVNLAKYLLKALEEDYQAPKASDNKKQQQQILETKKQKQQEQLKKAYQGYLQEQFESIWQGLALQRQQAIEAKFAEHIQTTSMDILKHLYKKEGLKNKMIAMEFRSFVKKEYSEDFAEVISFETYSANSADLRLKN